MNTIRHDNNTVICPTNSSENCNDTNGKCWYKNIFYWKHHSAWFIDREWLLSNDWYLSMLCINHTLIIKVVWLTQGPKILFMRP